MSLEVYRKPRLVVLHPRSTAYEAARAMDDNHIGVVLIAECRVLQGILTDRDLALEVVPSDLDPRTLLLADVMTTDVAALPIDGSVDDAVRIMRERACRRVPVLESGRLVGMVTLDDLLLNGAIRLEDAQSILHAQLDAGARLKGRGVPHPTAPARTDRDGQRAQQRRRGRAESTYAKLLRAIERQTGIREPERAEKALMTVLTGIVRRVRRSEAEHFIAQLPSKIHAELERHAFGPDRHVTFEVIEAQLRQALEIDTDTAAELVFRVCEAVADNVSMGEVTSLRGELPAAMKELFPAGLVDRRAAG